MRLAFVSCIFTNSFKQQPVWDWIAQHQPDHLLLLGDSIYLDVQSPRDPQDMDVDEFFQHQHRLYTELLSQPQLAALLQTLPRHAAHAIWDDHDFLWNNVNGAEVQPLHSAKVAVSSLLHQAFRDSLGAGGDLAVFAAQATGGLAGQGFGDEANLPLATPSVALAHNTWLHLSDGRSHRTRTWLLAEARRTLFGRQQLDTFERRILNSPSEAVHLWASGSTVASYQRYARDRQWLDQLAAKRRLLVLSGDLHRNQLDAFHTGGFALHEATSSGAALRDAVILGATRQNFGLLDIDAEWVRLRLFKRGVLELQRTISRQTWLPN